MPVDFNVIREVCDYLGMDSTGVNEAYLDTETGKVHYHSGWDAELGNLPEDNEGMHLIELSHKNDLNLGANLVEAFVDENLPDEFRTVQSFFRHRGAFARFKDLLASKDLLEIWYEFEFAEVERALRRWCEEERIEVVG